MSTEAWSTPRVAAAALLTGGIALLGCALTIATDAAGRTLIAVAGVLLLAVGGQAAALRPRLRLVVGSADTPATLTVRRLTGTRSLTPGEVTRIRVLGLRRIGRRSTQLEIDFAVDGQAEPALAVFGRWDLGADPAGVAETLHNAGFGVADLDGDGR
ncbi:MAG: PH domain-containing protein [Gordonia sp. (in: high G+C Gram-positive bacteria)]